MSMTEIEVLKNLIERAKRLQYSDNKELDDIRRKGKMVLENMFLGKSYWVDIGQIYFVKHFAVSMPKSIHKKIWEEGKNQLINLFDTALKDFELNSTKKVEPREIITERIIQVRDEEALNNVREEFFAYKKSVKNWTLFCLLIIILSSGLWIFYQYTNCQWFLNHPKKLAITLMTNLTILVAILNIPLKSNWLIWITAVIAVLTTLFSII